MIHECLGGADFAQGILCCSGVGGGFDDSGTGLLERGFAGIINDRQCFGKPCLQGGQHRLILRLQLLALGTERSRWCWRRGVCVDGSDVQ